MAHFALYSYKEFVFKITVGTGEYDGIVFHPTTSDFDFDNPEFMDAFKIAWKAFPIIEAHELLKGIVENPPGEIRHAPSSFLQEIIDRYALIQDSWQQAEYHIRPEPDVVVYVRECVQELTGRNKKEQERKIEQINSKTGGYVYLLQSPTKAYKIGRTRNPDNRLETFSVKLPFEVEYTCVIRCDDMYSLEKELHGRFADKRINGEWFNLSPEDVDHIKGLVQ